jgi:hypothetical protein
MEKKMVRVAVPPSSKPGLRGRERFRRQGPKRIRRFDTGEQTAAGIMGQPHRHAEVPAKIDYFTTEPEMVELTPWIQRALCRGNLVLVQAPLKPKAGSPSTPVPLDKKE